MIQINQVIVIALFILQGCSLVEYVALDSTAALLRGGMPEIETEENWHLFRDAAPGSIKFIEGMAYMDPKNLNLMAALTKSYAGFAYGVSETLSVQERLVDAEEKPYLAQAVHGYRKGLTYGLRYLELNGISFEDLVDQSKKGNLSAYLDHELNGKKERDVETVFFAGQSWAALTNLQKTNTGLVGQVYLAMGLIDWACGYRPDFQQGACSIAQGMYFLSRPKMLGGDPVKGEKIFRDAMARYSGNLLVNIAFLESFVIPRLDKKEFERQKKILGAAFKELPVSVPSRGDRKKKGALLNAIAKERFRILLKNEKELF